MLNLKNFFAPLGHLRMLLNYLRPDPNPLPLFPFLSPSDSAIVARPASVGLVVRPRNTAPRAVVTWPVRGQLIRGDGFGPVLSMGAARGGSTVVLLDL